MKLIINIILICSLFIGCKSNQQVAPIISEELPFTWDNATIYFLMTDRFYNGDTSNDYQHTEDNSPAPLRGYIWEEI